MEIGPYRVCEAHSNFLKLYHPSIKIVGNTYVENALCFLFRLDGGGRGGAAIVLVPTIPRKGGGGRGLLTQPESLTFHGRVIFRCEFPI